MKIRRVHIHNFRAIIEQDFMVADYCLLVGANRAGKSAVIDAIRCFYGHLSFSETDFPKVGSQDTESWVQITFELTDDEKEGAPEYAGAGILRLRRWLTTERKLDNKSAKGTLVYVDADGVAVDQQFQGWTNVGAGRLGGVVYIPAVSKPEDHDKTTGPSDFRDMLKQIMDDVVAESEQYRTLCDNIRAFGSEIMSIKDTDGHCLQQVETAITGYLAEWQVEAEIVTLPPQPDEILKNLTKLDLKDKHHGAAQAPSAFGSGFMRHYIYTLIRVRADLRKEKKADRKKSFAPNLQLILYEEPEAFLHPPQQEILSRSLRAVAAAPNTQVVVASHSAHFASRSAGAIPDMVRASRVDGCTKLYQIQRNCLDDLIADNDRLATENGITTSLLGEQPTLLRYYTYLNAERSGLFFAEYVLLVEGVSELALIHRLIDDGRISPTRPGYHIIECVGKYQVHRFMALLGHLGIQHGVLVDKDDGVDAEKLNKLINKARNDFTTIIETCDPSLEIVLGLARPDGIHASDWKRNKPLYLLSAFDRGELEASKLKTFTDTVSRILAP